MLGVRVRVRVRDRVRETKLPAIHAEHVDNDVAPVTAEYVPAKASNEGYVYVDSNTSVWVNTRKKKARRWGAGTRFTVKSSLENGTRE